MRQTKWNFYSPYSVALMQ